MEDEDENKEEKKKLLFFRIELAKQLVVNPYLPIRDEQEGDADGGEVIMNRRSKRVRMELDHDYAVAPQYGKKFTMVVRFWLTNMPSNERLALLQDAQRGRDHFAPVP